MSGVPRWMRALAVVCALTLIVTFFSDLFVPDARNVEVWFGFEVTGPAALATAPLHWAIFATFAWAFWTGRRWVIPAAAGYLFYVALCHLVWSEASPHGRGVVIGVAEAAVFCVLAIVLLRAGRRLPSTA